MKLYQNREWLYQKYIVEKLSTCQLAKIQNVATSTIQYNLNKFNIKTRNLQQSKSLNPNRRYFYRDKDWLFNQYVSKKKPTIEIAKICNVSHVSIFHYLKKFNIKKRSRSQASLEWKKKQIELGKQYFDLSWLKEKGKKLNLYEIAEIFNVNPSRIKSYAYAHNIKIKEKEPEWTDDRRRLISNLHKGSKNFRWNNGASEYKNHYELKKIRLEVLKRDEYKCKCCNKKATEIHHKDETKENHDINNLISVCHKCHIKQFHRGCTSKYKKKYGLSLIEICNKFGINYYTIHLWIKSPQKEAWLREQLEIKQ